ncbi:MAG: hypothetical protein CMJ48_02000 [Planctomycetaceae bacterium]|nr:hypothetical protein [Planctomycetaceae bacterium]
MPMLINIDPFGSWPEAATADSAAAALEAAHEAYCLVADCRSVRPLVSQGFSHADAVRLLDTFRACRLVFFCMEMPLGRPSPICIAAFGASPVGICLEHYYTFRERDSKAPVTCDHESNSIYHLAKQALESASDVDACYVPLLIDPPRISVRDLSGGEHKELWVPGVVQRPYGEGMLLSLS